MSTVREYPVERAIPRDGLPWGMLCLLAFTLVSVGRIQEVIPGLTSIHIGDVTGGLAVLAWLLAPAPFRQKVPLSIKEVRYVFILFSLAVLTIPIGVWPSHSLEFLIGPYFKTILFFLMTLFWCRSIRDMRRIVWVCCLGVIVLVVSGLASGSVGSDRFSADSMTYDANDLAFVLAMILPLTVYLFSTSGRVAKLTVVGMVFVGLYAVMLTMSRGGLLSLSVVAVLILTKSSVTKKAKSVLAAVLLVVFAGMASSEYWGRIGTMWNPQSEYDRTAGGRTTIWKNGLRILASHPWGVGIHGFVIAEGLSHGGEGTWKAPHNSFLQIAVELGVAGLILFTLLLGRTIRELRRVQRGQLTSRGRGALLPEARRNASGSIAQLALALELSLWSYVVAGFFLSQAYNGLLYAVCALGIACVRLSVPVDEVSTGLSRGKTAGSNGSRAAQLPSWRNST